MKVVVMDMNPHFREVAELCFPKAEIVVDRYHVTGQAVWAMERVRKTEQKKFSPQWREKLRIILGLSTRLEQAYDLKNDFLAFMHSPNSEIAAERLTDWLLAAENAGLPEFYECTRAVHNRDKLILNAFDCPYTNGFTEGCNNKTKVLKRVCFGVRNFSRFRSSILHCSA